MPASVRAPSGAPCWSDLCTSDPDRAVEFHDAILGRTAQKPSAEHGGYVNFESGGARIAGMVRDAESDHPDTWTTYLSVPDAKAAPAAAGAQEFVKTMQVDDLGTMSLLGGTVVAAAQDSPFGRLAQIADPTGASVKIVGVPAG